MDNNTFSVEIDGSQVQFPTISLPDLFIKWQSEARLKMFDMMKEKGATAMKMQPAHIAVMATQSDGAFPINLSSKGLGLLPKPEKLDTFTTLFEKAKKDTENRPPQETLPVRAKVMQVFYANLDNFDRRALGGLEIFEGQTSRNLQKNPRAALLYTGEAPKYPSYQFNGFVVRVDPGTPYYRFLLAARELFALDAFHIHQVKYPYGYLFYLVEAKDKTPFPRR